MELVVERLPMSASRILSDLMSRENSEPVRAEDGCTCVSGE